MAKRILVVNPNSNANVTKGLDEAVEPLRLAGGPLIECATLAERAKAMTGICEARAAQARGQSAPPGGKLH